MLLIANIEFPGSVTSLNQAQNAFDAFREATLPGTEWGLSMYNLHQAEDGTFLINIEIDGVEDIEIAHERLDDFREALLPSRDYGITIWGMQADEQTATLKM
jgi:hypothetical protein